MVVDRERGGVGYPETHSGGRDMGSVSGYHGPYRPAGVIGKIDIGRVAKKRSTVAFNVDRETTGTREGGDGEPVVSICVIRNAVVIIEAHHPSVVVLV